MAEELYAARAEADRLRARVEIEAAELAERLGDALGGDAQRRRLAARPCPRQTGISPAPRGTRAHRRANTESDAVGLVPPRRTPACSHCMGTCTAFIAGVPLRT